MVGVVGCIVAGRRNTTTPIAIDVAISNYQAAVTTDPVGAGSTTGPTTVPAPAPPSSAPVTPSSEPPLSRTAVQRLVAPGVYRMTTSGQESIDLLGGATHLYPAETALVVRPSGCGVRLEWTPLEERTEWWEMCLVDGGIAIVRTGGIHEFFGQRDERSVECPDRAWLVPPPEQSAETWQHTCEGSGLVDVRTVSIAEPTNVTIDGRTVVAVKIDMAVSTTGDSESATTRSLVLTEDGLPLSWSDNVLGTSDTAAGSVTYRETFEMKLVSTAPAT